MAFSTSLFDEEGNAAAGSAHKNQSLAVRMRPRTLEEFIGQEHILGPGMFLRKMIEKDSLSSIILFGPPGTGKTTLAEVIAKTTGARFEKLNAVSSGISDIRKIVDKSRERLLTYHTRTILFIDEIHRYNKGQQDFLLPFVENGTVILIGATTENPYFEINSPLLSRVRIIRLKRLEAKNIVSILQGALADSERGLGKEKITCAHEALLFIAKVSGGDARVALNILEQAAFMVQGAQREITPEDIEAVAGEKIQVYDKGGDNHYDIASAFIKSMRGSDPDAALHYLARMLEAGEDIKFIARRMLILASEDIGNADPQALTLAVSACHAVQFVGLPEARIILGQVIAYLACAPKSNASYLAVDKAIDDVRRKDCGEVPLHLKDSSYKGAKEFGHGKGYLYPHDYEGGYIKQQYLPDKLKNEIYYRPTGYGCEKAISERQKNRKGGGK